jgi:hypothetical protein
MDKEKHRAILTKLLMVWDANSSHSLFSLLANICGAEKSHYILHTFDGGMSDDIRAEVDTRIREVDDVELEGLLDELID